MNTFYFENLLLRPKSHLLNFFFILSIQLHFLNVFSQNNLNYLPSHITCFSAKLSGDKVYVNWILMGETHSGTYVIERSTDGTHFTPVGLKHGLGSAVGLELLYSWTDKSLLQVNSVYILRWIENSILQYKDLKLSSFCNNLT
jgi:hypothetical protein